MKRYFLKYSMLVFLVFQVVFYNIVKLFPELVEDFYSNTWFKFQSLLLRSAFGKIPFSVGDFLYVFLIFFGFKWFLQTRKTWRFHWRYHVLIIVNFCSVFYFLFHFCWGLNYYRMPLSKKMDIETSYSEQDLIAFMQTLVVKTNSVHLKITGNKNEKVVVPFSDAQLLMLGANGFENLAKKYTFFEYEKVSVKVSIFSKPLSYMGFGGYLNPFTMEAQVNNCAPRYGFLMIVSHEMAHQIGFANESECNFIGFLAATHNDNLFAQYAAYSFALYYCLNVLRQKNPEIAKNFYAEVHGGILKNYVESKVFWQSHESIVETGFKIFYDHFLKVNNQKDGLESYGKFLNLLINFEKQSAFRTKMFVK